MRGPTLSVVLVLCAAGLVAPETAGACDAGRHSRAVEEPGRAGRAPLVIGDSTSILAAPLLGRLGLEADARGCRQFGQGVQMLAARRRARTLPHVVVLALGANGAIGDGQVAAVLRIIGRHRVLALVTAKRSATSDATMHRAAKRHPDRVLLVDWVRHSAGHGAWFAGDGLHVGQEGARAYARLIRRSVAPYAFPPVRRLKIGSPGAGGRRCGVVRARGERMRVVIARGERRITCSRARTLARRPPMDRIAGWTTYDWRPTHSWSWVYARRDRRVLVGAVVSR
jgi:hypothetical protein